MKRIALALLGAAALLYALATALEARHPAWGYVAAFAEAAMVGAIADWFAVVALFRRPLNLPIPHTAIIPRNKDRIARGLSEFIQHNFLSAGALMQRIAEFQPAHTLCRWLLQPANADTVATYASRFLAYALAAIDDERVQRFLQRTVAAGIGKLDLAGAGGVRRAA